MSNMGGEWEERDARLRASVFCLSISLTHSLYNTLYEHVCRFCLSVTLQESVCQMALNSLRLKAVRIGRQGCSIPMLLKAKGYANK